MPPKAAFPWAESSAAFGTPSTPAKKPLSQQQREDGNPGLPRANSIPQVPLAGSIPQFQMPRVNSTPQAKRPTSMTSSTKTIRDRINQHLYEDIQNGETIDFALFLRHVLKVDAELLTAIKTYLEQADQEVLAEIRRKWADCSASGEKEKERYEPFVQAANQILELMKGFLSEHSIPLCFYKNDPNVVANAGDSEIDSLERHVRELQQLEAEEILLNPDYADDDDSDEGIDAAEDEPWEADHGEVAWKVRMRVANWVRKKTKKYLKKSKVSLKLKRALYDLRWRRVGPRRTSPRKPDALLTADVLDALNNETMQKEYGSTWRFVWYHILACLEFKLRDPTLRIKNTEAHQCVSDTESGWTGTKLLENVPSPVLKNDAETQLASYAVEGLSYRGLKGHMLNTLVEGDKMTLWYSDRRGILKAKPFDFVEDPLSFVATLVGMARLSRKDWGFLACVEWPADPAIPRSLKHGWIEMTINNEPAQFFLGDLLYADYSLAGRGTTVVRASCQDAHVGLTGRHLIAKMSWIQCSRQSEATILEHIIKSVEDKPKAKFLLNHLPAVHYSKDYVRLSEGPRGSLYEEIGTPDDFEDRVLRVLIMDELRPITDLPPDDFVKAFRDTMYCKLPFQVPFCICTVKSDNSLKATSIC